MCGIIAINKPNQFCKLPLRTLIHSLDIRGADSTGFVIQYKNGKIKTIKSLLAPSEFIKTPIYKREIEDKINELRNIIVHGRLATIGEITLGNCHPFHNYVHNGSVPYLAQGSTKTDSEILISNYLKEGISALPSNPLQGSYALAGINEEGNLEVIHDGSRLLFQVEKYSATWICSEKSMLTYALNRQQTRPFREYKHDLLGVEEIPKKTLIEFKRQSFSYLGSRIRRVRLSDGCAISKEYFKQLRDQGCSKCGSTVGSPDIFRYSEDDERLTCIYCEA